MTNKVTVVTVCYNIAGEIEKTLLSVINQTYNEIEYIIVDGGSTDGTVDIIKKYHDCITLWTSEPDNGIYDAMNKGLSKVTGNWIIFMNGGDCFHSPNAIAEVMEKVDDDSTIVYGRQMFLYPTFKYLSKNEPLNLERIRNESIMPHQSTFVKVDYHKTHPFDETLKAAADYKFFYNAYFKDKVKFQYVPTIVADFDDYFGTSGKVNVILKNESSHLNGNWNSIWFRTKLYLKVIKISVRNILPMDMALLYRKWHLKLQGFETFPVEKSV